MKWSHEQETLRIVNDQIANLIWARMLAEITAQALSRGKEYIRARGGNYHLAIVPCLEIQMGLSLRHSTLNL